MDNHTTVGVGAKIELTEAPTVIGSLQIALDLVMSCRSHFSGIEAVIRGPEPSDLVDRPEDETSVEFLVCDVIEGLQDLRARMETLGSKLGSHEF